MSDLATLRQARTFITRAAETYRQRQATADAATDKAALAFCRALAAANDAGVSYRVMAELTGYNYAYLARMAAIAREHLNGTDGHDTQP